jgi:hypothetical protein
MLSEVLKEYSKLIKTWTFTETKENILSLSTHHMYTYTACPQNNKPKNDIAL